MSESRTPPMQPEDFLDLYGECTRPQPSDRTQPRCRCLKEGWLGQACEHWRPLGATDWESMTELARRERA